MGIINDLNNVIGGIKDAVDQAKAAQAAANTATANSAVVVAPVTPVAANTVTMPDLGPKVDDSTPQVDEPVADDTTVDATAADEPVAEDDSAATSDEPVADDTAAASDEDHHQDMGRSMRSIFDYISDILSGRKTLHDIVSEEINNNMHKPLPDWAKNIPNATDR